MKNKGLKTMSRGILLLLVAMIIAVPLLWIYISLPTASYAVQNLEYDSSNVLEDLMSSEVIQNGQSKPFNLMDYPKDPLARSPKLINVVEYCYSARKAVRSHYGLYLYIYNPQQINFDDMSVQNKVQLAVTYDEEGKPEEYEKFDLQFCNRSVMAGTERLFYKYKVVDKKSADGKYIVDRVKGIERRYDISGFELLTKGESSAKDYTVGGTYKYSGYAKGCGADPEAESDLKCSVTDLETFEIRDLKQTYYRTMGYTSRGDGHRDQLNSVYFSLDSEIFLNGWELDYIRAEWYEYKTSPIIVTDNKEFYDKYAPHVGKVAGNDNIPVSIGYGYSRKITGLNSFYYTYAWSFNVEQGIFSGNKVSSLEQKQQLPYLFYTGGESYKTFVPKGNMVFNYINNYDKSYVNGVVPTKTKNISKDLLLGKVENGRKAGRNNSVINKDMEYDLLSYKFSDNDWTATWDKFWGKQPEIYEDFRGESPFVIVNPNSKIPENLLINKSDLFEFETFVNAKNALNKSVVLFRFALTDYYEETGISFHTELGNEIEDIGYMAEESVFQDFDILEFRFFKDGEYKTIPVVSNPIDIIPDFDKPLEQPDWSEWIKRILAIIVLIVILIVLAPVLPYVLKFVVWVVTLPFRAIGWLVKSIKKKQ